MSNSPKMLTLTEALDVCAEYDDLNDNCYFDKNSNKFRAQKPKNNKRDITQVRDIVSIDEEDTLEKFNRDQLMKALRDGNMICFAIEVPKKQNSRITKLSESEWSYLGICLRTKTAKHNNSNQQFVELKFQINPRLYNLELTRKYGSYSKESIILEAFNDNDGSTLVKTMTQDGLCQLLLIKIAEKGHNINERGFGNSSIKKTLRKNGKFK